MSGRKKKRNEADWPRNVNKIKRNSVIIYETVEFLNFDIIDFDC